MYIRDLCMRAHMCTHINSVSAQFVVKRPVLVIEEKWKVVHEKILNNMWILSISVTLQADLL